jgi:hypothetical protein
MDLVHPRDNEALCRLVDRYRARCLWFLHEGYYPETPADALRVLDSIQRHGDVEAFQQAGAFKQWLLAPSSAKSVSS